ncbi:E3 ubiquitin-protein ligase sina [Zootermopsis nevadensis]|uniref:E3 ubiquitin-protein ligase sina n=1 Tax=Zootermopsis nevadensis TaxID=136037 RepID=A0A067R7Y7_ZOONE|nr:E3 ubiquitin-protein ligase sina [Zootermopsis nevadensis]
MAHALTVLPSTPLTAGDSIRTLVKVTVSLYMATWLCLKGYGQRLVGFEVLTAVSLKIPVFWVAAPCSLVEVALMMEAARTSETSVNFYQTTQRNTPEDGNLHTHRPDDGGRLKMETVCSSETLESIYKTSKDEWNTKPKGHRLREERRSEVRRSSWDQPWNSLPRRQMELPWVLAPLPTSRRYSALRNAKTTSLVRIDVATRGSSFNMKDSHMLACELPCIPEQEQGLETKSEVECASCKDNIKPPSTRCDKGHNICNKCRPLLQVCPTCRKTYHGARNYVAENVARLTVYNQALPTIECSCPISITSGLQCSWTGKLEDIKKHIIQHHDKRIVDKSGKFSMPFTTVAPLASYSLAISTLGEVFLRKAQVKDENFYLVVMYIGPQKNAGRYKYTFTISKKNSVESISGVMETGFRAYGSYSLVAVRRRNAGVDCSIQKHVSIAVSMTGIRLPAGIDVFPSPYPAGSGVHGDSDPTQCFFFGGEKFHQFISGRDSTLSSHVPFNVLHYSHFENNSDINNYRPAGKACFPVIYRQLLRRDSIAAQTNDRRTRQSPHYRTTPVVATMCNGQRKTIMFLPVAPLEGFQPSACPPTPRPAPTHNQAVIGATQRRKEKIIQEKQITHARNSDLGHRNSFEPDYINDDIPCSATQTKKFLLHGADRVLHKNLKAAHLVKEFLAEGSQDVSTTFA